jgi:hypothetical protein
MLTLPPTPPQTPPPNSKDEECPLEDEDGFAHVPEDYHEYERWFAEEDQLELGEMSKLCIHFLIDLLMNNLVMETLTKEEIANIKMAAIQLFGHISQHNYE